MPKSEAWKIMTRILTLLSNLREKDWFKVVNCEDVNVAWSNFKTLFYMS